MTDDVTVSNARRIGFTALALVAFWVDPKKISTNPARLARYPSRRMTLRKLQSLLLACLIFTSAESCVPCPEHTESPKHTESLENTEFLLAWNSKRAHGGTFSGFPNYANWAKTATPGMTQASVRNRFGMPDASIERDGVTEWNWQQRFLRNHESLTIRFINNKVSEAPKFEVVTIPEFMLSSMYGGLKSMYGGLKSGITDTQVIWAMGEKPTSIVMEGNRATYIWEHTSRFRKDVNDMVFGSDWIIGDGLYHFSVKVHIENGKQVGDAIVEESKVR